MLKTELHWLKASKSKWHPRAEKVVDSHKGDLHHPNKIVNCRYLSQVSKKL